MAGTLFVLDGDPELVRALACTVTDFNVHACVPDARPEGGADPDAGDYLLVRDPSPPGAGASARWRLVAGATHEGVPVAAGDAPAGEVAGQVASWLARQSLASGQRRIVSDLEEMRRGLETEREALRRELAEASRELERTNGELHRKIEDLSRLNQELEHIREINANIIEALQESLIACDEDGRITHSSRDAAQLLGWDAGELLGRPIASVLRSTPDKAGELNELLGHSGGRRVIAMRLLTRSGDYRLVECRVSPLGRGAPGERGRVILFTDLARREREQELVRRRDRLASLGELSAGVAHEIRNPLAAITTTAELLRGRLPEESPDTEFVDVILEEVGRLDKIITDLLMFARPRPPQPIRGDLHRTLDRMLLLLRRQIGKREIEVVRRYDRTLPQVELDPDQLLQLFLNLGLNATEAMADGGTLTITTQRAAAPRPADANGAWLPGVRILVEDTGCGISPEVRERAFNPFFTTKGKGSGLGLAICQRIVEDHQGSIYLESTPGRSTTVVVDLPISTVTPSRDPQTELFGSAAASLDARSGGMP